MDNFKLKDLYLETARGTLSEGMRKIEHCVNQLTDAQVWWRDRPEMNSIANLMLHLSGNVRQWIVSGIGGSPDTRNRPREFSDHSGRPKTEILASLKAAVDEADAAMARLSADDLVAERKIQGFDSNVTSALFHSISHFRGHTQEIIHLTRVQLGDKYKFDFVPQGAAQLSAGGSGA
jgi:hypothetical protein